MSPAMSPVAQYLSRIENVIIVVAEFVSTCVKTLESGELTL